MKTIKNSYIYYGLVLATGLFLGWLLFGRSSSDNNENGKEHIHAEESQVWTCSMHPQIRQDKPGKCPICAMDLIPLKTTGGMGEAIDPGAVVMSKEAIALANVQTTVVGRSKPAKEIHLYGTIQPNERLSRSFVSHVNGRIEKLNINFAGENVRAGQVVASIYSPELLVVQQELLETVKIGEMQPALLHAAREKLRLWKLTDKQIADIEQSGKVSPFVDVIADMSGTVVAKNVEQGDYVSQGSILFDLTDLSSVWAVFNAYEADLPYLKTGDKVEYTLQALPNRTFSGKIAFIDPVIDKTTRTAKVRVETPNTGLQLKPEMYANAVVKATLGQGGDQIVIPRTAVLWTGIRSIVYVKQPNTDIPAFNLREIELGPVLGNSYVVLSGIAEGEEIVTNGAFVIDASAQLEGKRSMMNTPEPQSSHSSSHSSDDLKSSDELIKEHGKQDATAEKRKQTSSSKDQVSQQHAMVKVEGLCEMCKERIEGAAKGVNGVTSAAWNMETKELHLNFNPEKTSADAVSKTVAKAGHDTEKYKAGNEAYNALPDCCKYRE